MEFSIGDKVKHRDFIYEFKIVFIDNNNCILYSPEMSYKDMGHNGTIMNSEYLGNGDSYGHYYAHESYITKAEGEKSKFSIGDTVEYDRQKFEIVAIDHEHTLPYTIYSRDWRLAQKGHDGKRAGFCGNGERHGHYFMDEKNLKLINKNNNNEVFRSDSEGCPRGIESKIHSESIKIASGIRPTGSRTTACRIGIKVGTGIISNNRIQPH